ncbi:MAG: DUF4065 domain-containing protein [Alphaproteobacteria bacterium]|nr:MAG: DUF4065 domain-containing protein [Alphaproteobacteria bacterium]TAF14453.1 MAG: DUF4065 domain-containing protein [Alphaproteobacteria bacterium]TAF38766.1 MAG: DUF4065 domain-containing protein [Alphaproteobacteria bacterium]TAF77606.1 MAG: DUF4065 domain-containing protein [Alphaproteobacteria bacterium]
MNDSAQAIIENIRVGAQYQEVDCDGYTPAEIANRIIQIALDDGKRLTPMQLIKLTYIAYTWYYAWKGRRLFDEKIEAWQHGPVIPSLYHEFKRFGSKEITEFAKELDENEKLSVPDIGDSEDDMKLLGMLHEVWQEYGHYSASKLRNLTHQKESPWSKAHVKGKNNYIRLEDMKERALVKLGELMGQDSNECT